MLDNLSNSFLRVLDHMKRLAGSLVDKLVFVQGDLRDAALLTRLFSENTFDAVIHFAGYKAVGESVEKPLEYYDNNVGGSLTLLEAMRSAGCKAVCVLCMSSSLRFLECCTPNAVPCVSKLHLPAKVADV